MNVCVFSPVPYNPSLLYVYREGNQQEKNEGKHIVIDYTIEESELMKRLKDDYVR